MAKNSIKIFILGFTVTNMNIILNRNKKHFLHCFDWGLVRYVLLNKTNYLKKIYFAFLYDASNNNNFNFILYEMMTYYAIK